MDSSESAGLESAVFGISIRKVVPWGLSTDDPALPWLQLRWLGADAQGHIFQGECLQKATRQLQALGANAKDVDML